MEKHSSERIAEAEAFEAQERWLDAVEAWRALAAEEDRFRFVLRGAMAAERGAFNAEAEKLFRQAIHRAPKEPAGYVGFGFFLYKIGRLQEARESLEIAVGLEEQQFALTALGIIQRHLGDLDAAMVTLRRSLVLDPDDDEAHFALGLALALEEPLAALDHYRHALELDPDLPNLRREMGETLCRLGQNEEAEAVLRQALAAGPSDVWVHCYLGNVLGLRDEWREAQTEFIAATEQMPDVGMFWRCLADACAHLDQRAEADRYYLKALSLGMDDAYATARYGIFLKYYGQFRKARFYLRRAIELDPAQRQAAEALDELDQRS
jgi:Tfp pilus assembly protein PilF